MEELLQNLETDAHGQVVHLSLYSGLRKHWDLFGNDLLYCFDIPGLPQVRQSRGLTTLAGSSTEIPREPLFI
jgi:hypothetical protein